MRAALPILLVAFAAFGAQADPLNLESGLPIEVEDAYPAPFLNREFQSFIRYERLEDGTDVGHLVTRLEVGVYYNTELTVEAPFVLSEQEPDGYGDTRVELLYNTNQETRVLPAFAIAGTLIAPTAEESRGVDSQVELIATKTIPGTWELHRLHGNVAWRFNAEERSGERDGTFEAILGYEVRVTNQLVLLADVLRKQELAEEVESNLAEIGVRYALTPYSLLAVGAGFGFGDESPDARATVGLQLQF